MRAGPYLFVTSQWGGARMLRLAESRPDAALVWQGVGESDPRHGRDFDTLDSVISTPVIRGGHVYGVDGEGILRCLELRTGRRVWETDALIRDPARWATAFFVVPPRRSVAIGLRGFRPGRDRQEPAEGGVSPGAGWRPGSRSSRWPAPGDLSERP